VAEFIRLPISLVLSCTILELLDIEEYCDLEGPLKVIGNDTIQ